MRSILNTRSRLSWKIFLPTLVLVFACAGGALLAVEHSSFASWLKTIRVASEAPATSEDNPEALELAAAAGLDLLVAAEHKQANARELAKMAEELVQTHAKSSVAGELRRRRDGYYRRAEEHEIESARAISAKHPLEFQSRLQPYRDYLDHHPLGAFVGEARQAVETITQEWDKYDFRIVRDHYVRAPGDVQALAKYCRAYQASHPEGLYRSYAGDLLRWGERVSLAGEYRMTLHSGVIERKLTRWLSRGPDVSVVLEVGGVRHGPTNIAVNSYTPEWQYEFPRRIRWKLGEHIRILVTDHDYWDRVILEASSSDGDMLALALLNGEIEVGGSRLVFSTDFTMPALPTIE
ncbi:hypothetical protein BH10PLA2_BH10PLA2_18770 [soil metagenome]